jgi:peroxiredoxin
MFVDSTTVARGSTAPDFDLPDQAGRATSLREFRGHPVVLVFLRGFL